MTKDVIDAVDQIIATATNNHQVDLLSGSRERLGKGIAEFDGAALDQNEALRYE